MKEFLKLFKWWEIFAFAAVLCIVFTLALVFQSSFLTILNTILGIVGVALLSKGLVLGNVILIVQSIFYCWMNAINAYYGEVIVSVCISIPLYVLAVINWKRNPSGTKEVLVNTNLGLKDYLLGVLLTTLITTAVFFVMKVFNTSNLALSTCAAFSCIMAAYLSIRRSQLNFLFYIINSIFIISMWVMVVLDGGGNQYYITICHCSFSILLNCYAIFNWQKIKKKQKCDDNFAIIMKAIKN